MSDRSFPGLAARVGSVWWRHVRVYASSLFSNALPPFLEPLIFLAGIGLGLGQYLVPVNGVPYIRFLAMGLIVTSAMYTAAFENTFGTFIRLEFDKVYDGMLAASLTAEDILIGEILFSSTKGAFFSLACLAVLAMFGLLTTPYLVFSFIAGFLCAAMFACLSLFVTSFVGNINHFNFYFTLFISPLFFFSGVVFPLEQLPEPVRVIAYFLPLTHAVNLVRSLSVLHFGPPFWGSLLYTAAFLVLFGRLAVHFLKKRMVS